MEIILAIVVASAVIFFGALISMGNERQRRAIDGLKEQVMLWAVQDLKIKREALAHDVKIVDPLAWFNRLATKILGYDLHLQFVEAFDDPQVLVCISDNMTTKVIFTTLSPRRIRQLKHAGRNKLSRFAERNPLWSFPRNVIAHEFSLLNCGLLFDIELPVTWKLLTGQDLIKGDRLWIYICS